MIIVTVGTEKYPFDRLLKAVDGLRDQLKDEPVFMQTGSSAFTPSYPHESFISYKELREKIREARIVVAHAGAGTLLMCIELGKIPVMMPRKRSFREHVDDHQNMLATSMAEKGLIILAETPEQVQEKILNYDEYYERRKIIDTKAPSLVHHLKEVLNQLP